MRRASRGAILLVSSGYGLAPATRAPVYSAAKAALHSLSKSLRRQLAPLMDMLRFEQTADGPASVAEFGSASTAQGGNALRAVSAYHNVRNLTAYPAVLFSTGWNDARVGPWQAGKMAARLQAANPGGKPALLRIDFEGGYGPGTPRARRLEELADIYVFLLWQLGDPQFQPSIVEVPSAAANAQSFSAMGPNSEKSTPWPTCSDQFETRSHEGPGHFWVNPEPSAGCAIEAAGCMSQKWEPSPPAS